MYIRYSVLGLLVLLLLTPCALAQEPAEVLPKLIDHAEPMYPPLARQTRISGDVRVKITTNGQSVIEAAVESGHPLLRKAAEDNVRTWKFVAHTPGSYCITFRYKLASGGVEVTFPESGAIVQIEAPVPQMSIYYSWMDLGTWKVELSSSHAKAWRIFKLYFSGPEDDWLAGSAVDPKGKEEKIDFGHMEGDFLAFTINLRQPDGQRMKTFFVGKMSKYKIVGTFVDNAGVTGEWTAVRLAEKPNSR